METNPYIQELTQYLKQLSQDELNDVIDFYSEYIMDAGLTDQQEIINKLGTPKQLSRKILADYSIRALDNDQAGQPHYEPKSKKNIRMIWLVILAMFASPVAIPVAIAVLACIFGLLVAVVAVVISAFLVLLALFAVGIIMIGSGFAVVGSSIPTSIFFVSGGIALIGITMVIAPVSYLIIKVLIQMVANFTQWIYHRYVKKDQQQFTHQKGAQS